MKSFEATTEIKDVDEVVEMAPELVMAVEMTLSDSGFLDGAVHPLDLAVDPRVVGLG